jgi:rfaE bifunctional protein nucleotidyltransferase chain/domain
MRVVMANGCFDPLHAGHVLHLERAKEMGDVLVVALTDDEHVRAEKGEGRPVLDAQMRKRALLQLRCVDIVLLVPSVLHGLDSIRPDVFVKGSDYVGRIALEVMDWCESHSTAIRFTQTPKLSATGLLNELRRG